jgi:hypothetical protein
MDPQAPNSKCRTTPEFAQYQRENFWAENEGKAPVFNTDPTKLEERAKEKLSEGGWFYASSNAGQSMTHLANRQAFYRHKVVPRMLVDTNIRDSKTEIWGHKVTHPGPTACPAETSANFFALLLVGISTNRVRSYWHKQDIPSRGRAACRQGCEGTQHSILSEHRRFAANRGCC